MEFKKIEEKLCLFESEELVESYETGNEIDFSKLSNFLIRKDFESKIELIDSLPEKSEHEKNIFSFIKNIIDDYNKKVDEFKNFVAELKNEE